MLIQLVLDAIAATVAEPIVTRYHDPSLHPPMTRADFVASVSLSKPLLEIGPFDRPWLSGPEVRYFDVLSQDGLKARAEIEPRRRPNRCPFIHYVSPTGNLSVVTDTFSSVFSSHCIEHQPDLVGHLREVGRLLSPDGRYYLIIPDKRFCFDHFIPETSFEDILTAKGRTHHAERKIKEHTQELTHNNHVLHWLGIHGQASPNDPIARARHDDFLKRSRSGEYVDVHAWQFTPSLFRDCMQRLYDAGEIPLQPLRVHNTGFAKIEFMAVLTKHSL